jgi:TolB protein
MARSYRWLLPLALGSFAIVFALSSWSAGQPPPPPEGDEPPLPVFEVEATEPVLVKIGIPDFLGAAEHGRMGGGIARNDFTLMPGYRPVGPESIRHDVAAEGLNFNPASWRTLGVDGVIKAQVEASGDSLTLEMRFYRTSSPGAPAYQHTYQGPSTDLRRWVHEFDNEVLRVLTGKLGPFGTKLTFARRIGQGRKDVMCSHMDGYNVMRVSNGRGIAMLPAFGDDGHIFFTRLTNTGMFITRSATNGRRIISGNGLNMGPTVCNDKIFFVSSRDGNSEIYSSNLEGGNVRRLTNHPAIDVSPSCGPNNKLAFVSARHGTPQIWMMNQDGSQPVRLTFQGSHNQTPAFCRDPDVPLVAFTGRDMALDIFTVHTETHEIRRLTEGQGNNKDPAFSPDCRIVAFVSDRRGAPGVYLSSTLGFSQHRVVEGEAETVRWAHRAAASR